MKRTLFIQTFIALITISALLSSTIYAQDLSGKPGAFADIGMGLRSVGMGGAYTALANDENASRWNPAMLADLKRSHAGFTWTKQFSVVPYHYLSLAMPITDKWGGGAFAISSGDDVYRETTIGLGAGTTLNLIPDHPLDVGGTLKILSTSYGNDPDGGEDRVTGSSFGLGLDLGVHYQPAKSISLALVGRDLISINNWDSSVKGKYSESIPTALSFAAAYTGEKITFAGEFLPGLYGDVPGRVAGGVELNMLKVFRFRAGLAQNISDPDLNRWITLGLGIEFSASFLGPVNHVRFGYTHMVHEIDPSPRVGLAFSW